MQMLGYSKAVVQLYWITQIFISTVGPMRVIFLLFVSAAMDFTVSLRKRVNPCHLQGKKKKKK